MKMLKPVTDFIVNQYNKNPRFFNDTAGILAFTGLGKLKDTIQNKKTSWLDYLTYAGLGLGTAEAVQWGLNKNKHKLDNLLSVNSNLEKQYRRLVKENTHMSDKLYNASPFGGKVLSPDEIEILKAYLNDQKGMLNTILGQNKFLTFMKDDKAHILPSRNQ
jgi:hypothetical protein